MKQLTEKETEDFLEKNELKVVQRAFSKKKTDLKKVEISFPWVMKVSSTKIMHKARVNGVRVNIKTIEEAEKCFIELSKIENFEEVIIQKMISGKEAILGIKHTPEFGHVLMFGKGGSNIEKEKDVSFRVIPIKEEDIKSMILDTKFSKELSERENKNIIEAINKIQKLIKNNSHITELDINPLMVNDKEYMVADARIVMK
ncbi:MAG: acetate--CoA ligase family protein [archaeon]